MAGTGARQAGLLGLLAPALLLAPGRATWSECGQKGDDTTAWISRIVNGQRSTRCEWRWHACLKYPDRGVCWCGGTLLSEQWVLTAGHCVIPEYEGSFNVMLGEFNQYDPTDRTEEEIAVEKFVIHPDYNDDTLEFDFALVKLATPAPLNNCIGTACLPTADMALAGGVDCFVTGWGHVQFGGPRSRLLLEAEVQTVSQEDCNEVQNVSDDMLCAHGRSNGAVVDACQGDSGGPLVCQSNGTWYVHGVTSWGYYCDHEHFPGVYARVTHQIDWIKATMSATPVSTPVPTPLPPFPPGRLFQVVSGPCAMDGYCVQSSNYPREYGANELCIIAVDDENPTPLEVLDFRAEAGYDRDRLLLNAVWYTGSAGPDGVVPTTNIVWTSDFAVNSTGWKICPGSHVPTPPPTPQPPFPPGQMFMVMSGPCMMDGYCVQSGNYPSEYDVDEVCIIAVDDENPSPLEVLDFQTEDGWDVLIVNGVEYTGSVGPNDVVPTTDITWISHYSDTSKGWKICPTWHNDTSHTESLAPTATPTPFCVDFVPPGQDEWYDSDGPFYNCEWLAQSHFCQSIGKSFENFNKTANEACCVCIRLADMQGDETSAPTAAPATPSPAVVRPQQSQITTEERVSAAGTLDRPPLWCCLLWASWSILFSARRALM